MVGCRTHTCREAQGINDFLVKGKLKMGKKWNKARQGGKERKVLKARELKKEEKIMSFRRCRQETGGNIGAREIGEREQREMQIAKLSPDAKWERSLQMMGMEIRDLCVCVYNIYTGCYPF